MSIFVTVTDGLNVDIDKVVFVFAIPELLRGVSFWNF